MILIAEGNDDCFEIVQKSFFNVGLRNKIIRFNAGSQIKDFLFSGTETNGIDLKKKYLILLCIDEIDVLQKIKNDENLSKIPVIILMREDSPEKIETCCDLGCSMCILRPDDDEYFIDILGKIGRFLLAVEIPKINKPEKKWKL